MVSPKPPRAERRETTSPTGVTVKRKKERGGWKAGAGERTAGDEDGTGEDLGSTHCVGTYKNPGVWMGSTRVSM